jgi:hypothetical protein
MRRVDKRFKSNKGNKVTPPTAKLPSPNRRSIRDKIRAMLAAKPQPLPPTPEVPSTSGSSKVSEKLDKLRTERNQPGRPARPLRYVTVPGPDGPIRLTSEQLVFVKAYTDPAASTYMKANESYRLAYPNIQGNPPGIKETARKSPNLSRAIEFALEKAGVTDDLLATKLREGLDAMKTELVTFQGAVTDQVDMIAWDSRHRYLDTALKVKGHFPKEDVNVQTALILKIPPRTGAEEFEKEFATTVDAKP